MQSITSLDIKGHCGQPVPSTFFFQDQEAQHLAIVFPGFAYTADMPVLYYPSRLLVQRSADLLQVTSTPIISQLSGGDIWRGTGTSAGTRCCSGL